MPIARHGKTEYVTTVRIAAPATLVWTVLTDAPGYADWNPEILHVAGRFGLNERIKVRVKVGSGGGAWTHDAHYGV